ncbi:MAG: hypothetical protein HUJ54_05895, partial [Erysipelotrichaceae bacterium]|nr:hypothetical protein [Erysipelotrichaceae bacterium]
MNWLLSIVFWSAMFLEFEFLGFAVNQFARYRTGIIKNWLTGYFAFFLLTMPLGYVFQLTCGSWNLYFVLQALIVLAANAGVFLGLRKAGLLRPLAAEIRAVFTKEGLRQALSENWFGLVWIGICMFFLISSQLGVMETAYDEYYYIGKMVNLQGADQMFMEEYHNGALLASPAFDPARFLNTYELAYAWLASLFGIGIPFFARITMSAMQYVLLFFLAKETAACFVLRKYAQFATAGFLVFVLPDPFWRGVRNLLNVGLYSYDLWQFQLTPYFGSSVVRMSGFFALFHFSVPLLKKMQWKQVLWVGAVSAVLLGYSTCVLPVFGMFALGIILAKLTVTGCAYWQQGDKRKAGLYLAGAVLLFAALLAVNKFIGLPDTELYQDYARAIGDFMQGHYIYDFSILTAVFVLAAAMLFCRNRIQVSFVLVLAFLYFSIVKLGLFNLVARLGFGYEFVTLRAIAGVQTMLYFTAALLLMKIWRWF